MLLIFSLLLFLCESSVKSLTPPFPPTQLPAVTTVKSLVPPLPPAKLLLASTVKSQLSTLPPHSAPSTIDSSTAAPEETFSLQLEAVPDHPVAEGQRVNLLCRASPMPASAQWSWQRLQNHTWHVMQDGGDLTLSQPEESGLYRCRAEGRSSQSHAVYITSMQTTVSEYLGIAAFVLSLLALIIISAHLFWLSYRRLDATLTTPNVAAQGFPGAEKSPKGGLPHAEGGGDVYMNYTNTSQAYTDLDPTSMTREDLYSSLS